MAETGIIIWIRVKAMVLDTVMMGNTKASRIKDINKLIMVATGNSITLIKHMDTQAVAVMDTKVSQTRVIMVVATDSSKVCRIKERLKAVEVKHRFNLKEELVARKTLARRASRIKDLWALSLLHNIQLLHLVAVSRAVFLDKGFHLVNLELPNNLAACPVLKGPFSLHRPDLLLLHWSVGPRSTP
jgi:hypothetical protein